MNDKLMSTVVSALVGGIVGAAVVFFIGGSTKFDSLEVKDLKITQSAKLVNAEGRDDVMIRDGSVMANNVVLGKKFIGTQYQGHVFVGNRMFTSPDDLVTTPMDKWKFYTEIGSSSEIGGEMIVRSANGANVVGQEIHSGVLLRAGFDANNAPQLFARGNENGVMFPVPFLRPNPQQQAGAEGDKPAEGVAAAPAPAPAPAPETPTTAAKPEGDTVKQ